MKLFMSALPIVAQHASTERSMRRLSAAFIYAALVVPALAAGVDEQLADPVMEARARALGHELRCVVCQNQSIEESNALLARDMRLIIREQLKAGQSDDKVKAYLVERYGNFVLLKPPVEPMTWLLWFGPFLLLGGGAIAAIQYVRRLSTTTNKVPEKLSAADIARMKEILREDSDHEHSLLK